MLKNCRGPTLGATLGGLLGFGGTWLVIERAGAGESWPLVPNGAWYGVGIGLGAIVLYVACGGESAAGATGAASLAATLVALGTYTFLVASEAREGDPGDLVVGALVVFWDWVVPLALLLLVLPAAVTALALRGVAALVARPSGRPRRK